MKSTGAILLITTAVLVVKPVMSYSVVVNISPQSPIPFTVEIVTLTCSVTPLPPPPVTYTWTSVPGYSRSPNSPNTSLPVATAYVNYDYPRHITYYCHVHSNGIKVEWGESTATVQGLLQHVSSPVVNFSLAQNITLQFEVFTDHFEESHMISGYNWFHNDCCIDCVYNARYQFKLSNTQLTILNATDNDAGVYEARVTSFDVAGNLLDDKWCVARTHEHIKHHAAYGPVTFHLTKKNEQQMPKERMSFKTVYGAINERLTLATTFEPQNPAVYMYQRQWYINGSLVSTGNQLFESNATHVVIDIPKYRETYAGEYAVQYTNNDCKIAGCDPLYKSICIFATYHSDVIHSFLKISISTLTLPQVTMNTHFSIVESGTDSTTLNCTATGGNPMEYTLTLMRGEKELISSTSSPLVYTPTYYTEQFGLFTCKVHNHYYTIHNSSVLIQEKDYIQGSFAVDKYQNKMQLQDYINFINAAVIKTMNTVCEYCNLTTEHLTESSVTDDVLGSVLYYTSALVYSSPSGNTTASGVIALTQRWLTNNHNNIVVHINNTQLTFNKLCLLNHNEFTEATCQRIIRSLKCFSSSAVTGAAFGGLVCGIIITILLVVIITIEKHCARKRKTVSQNSTQIDNNDQKTIDMSCNNAYEIPQCYLKRNPLFTQINEEVIYDQPSFPQKH